MSEESYFQKALSNFIFDFACGGALRHLAEQGYTARQITDRLAFPISYERVRQAVTAYYLDEGILLRKEPAQGGLQPKYVYVQEHGEYGKTSFRRVPVVQEEAVAEGSWTERHVTCAEVLERLRAQGHTEGKSDRALPGNGEKSRQGSGRTGDMDKDVPADKTKGQCETGKGNKIYVSCDFGGTGLDFEGTELLNDRQREYLAGICWDRKRMYHLLNDRMREIVLKLCEGGCFDGKVYFMSVREAWAVSGTGSEVSVLTDL